MKRSDVDVFEKLVAQLNGFYQELSVLVKKAQNDAVNPFKLNFINNVLQQSNSLLGAKYRPFPDFESFSPDDVPSNSDVIFIISQYIECAEKFRADNITKKVGSWYWVFEDEGPPMQAAQPKKLNK